MTQTITRTLSLTHIQSIEEHPRNLNKILVTVDNVKFETERPTIDATLNATTISGSFSLFTDIPVKHRRKRIIMRSANRFGELQSRTERFR